MEASGTVSLVGVTGVTLTGTMDLELQRLGAAVSRTITTPGGDVTLSFDAAKLTDNIRAFIDHILAMHPSSVRGQYVKSISISATMTPGIMVAA